MSEEVKQEHIFVAYSDGGARPNPGYGGYGVFGYTLRTFARPSRAKFPIGTKYHFTSNGITVAKDPNPYDTTNIYEYIGSCPDNQATNNLGEIYAFRQVLRIALTIEDLTKVHAITDSKYVIEGFQSYLDSWIANNYCRKDGKEISNLEAWKELATLREQVLAKGIEIQLTWVKGHSEEPGNEIADLFASVGLNAARLQDGELSYIKEETLYQVTSYKDYKDSLEVRDNLNYYKDLYFSNAQVEDSNYCFLMSSEDESIAGRKDLTTIFSVNVGNIPNMVNEARNYHRSFYRDYHGVSCLRIGKLYSDKTIKRLVDLIGIKYLLVAKKVGTDIVVSLVNDKTPLIFDYDLKYPFKLEVSNTMHSCLEIYNGINNGTIPTPDDAPPSYRVKVADITDTLVVENKLIITNRDKVLDISDAFPSGLVQVNKLLLTLGRDLPSYLNLKKFESDIVSIKVALEASNNNNLATLYVIIDLGYEQIVTTNTKGKYVVVLT